MIKTSGEKSVLAIFAEPYSLVEIGLCSSYVFLNQTQNLIPWVRESKALGLSMFITLAISRKDSLTR